MGKDRSLIVYISGLPFAAYSFPKHVHSALAYKPTKQDLFVVAFPKSGTTWMQNIFYMLLRNGEVPNPSDVFIFSPFLEMHGADAVKQMEKPGVIKTHLPFDRMPFSDEAKYIAIIRNPKDVMVSYYHHLTTVPFRPFQHGTFQEFSNIFLAGKNPYGNYFKHLKSWYNARNRPNVLILFFEELKTNPKESILKVADFIGVGDRVRKNNEQLLNFVVENSNFSNMQKVYKNFKFTLDICGEKTSAIIKEMLKKSPNNEMKVDFLTRKGVVGDWENQLTPEINAKMDDWIKESLHPKEDYAEIVELWVKHGIINKSLL